MTDDILARFDEIAGDIDRDMAERRRAAGLVATDRNPDEFARARQLADKHGAPLGVVADNLPDYEREDREQAFGQIERDHPALGPLLRDQRWRTLAQDDAQGVNRLATALRRREIRDRGLLAKSAYSLFGLVLDNDRGRAFLDNLDDVQATVGAAARSATAALSEAGAESHGRVPAGAGTPGAAADLAGAVSGVVGDALFNAVATPEQRQQAQTDRKAAAARFEMARARAAAEGAAARDEAAAIQQSYGDGTPGYYAMGIARSAPLMAAAALTRNPAIGATLIGGVTAAEQRSSALADGATPLQATASGIVHGTLEGTMDMVTLGIARYGLDPIKDALTRRFGASVATRLLTRATSSAPGRLATAAGAGAATEVPTTVGQMASDELILGTDYTPEDLYRGVRDSIVQGGVLSGGLYAASAPLRAMEREADADLHRSLRAADDLADLQEITAAAAESRLGARSPEDVAAIAQAVASGDRVYITADDARVLFQNDPRLLADLVGGDDALTEQLASGDVSIPMAAWVSRVARMPNVDEILRHARRDPDGLSAAELERLDAEGAALAGDTAEAAERATPAAPDGRQQVIDDVMGQLIATDRYTPAQAEAQAKLWGAAFSIFGKRARQDPFALYQRYMAGIRSQTSRPDPRATRPFSGSARLDALIESVRTGIEPNQSEVFGPSLTEWLTDQGGVQDQTGELRSFDARRLRPGLARRDGLTLDHARELAAEAGYLSPDSTVADFLDLIDRDLRSNDVRSEQQANSERLSFDQERRQFMDAFDNNPRLRDMPREELARLTNQQIAEELFGATTLDQTAYHGTPHTVDLFSLQKIGTGEGAQAYGWGLYFASEREIAEYYKNTLGAGAFEYDGVPVNGDNPKRVAVELLWSWQGDKDGAKDDADGYENASAIKREIAKLDPEKITRGGKLYSVDIPEDSELLDYDKPLSEQPEKVRKALAGLPHYDSHYTGGKFYQSLSREWRSKGGERAVSEALAAAGIPGLRYLDGGSRSAGAGTHNYVIWDENAISEPRRLYQSSAGGSFAGNEPEPARSDRPERGAFEALAAIGGRVPAAGWSAATRIRDRDGNPGTVYRGSRDGTTSPDDFGRVGAATGHPSAGLGVWFSGSRADAANYGTASPYHLDLRRPKIYTVDDAPEFDTIGEAVALRKELQAAGHDGIVFDFRAVGGPRQFVVFAPEQVVLPEAPAKTLRQDAAPSLEPARDDRNLLDRAIDGVKTLFQRKPTDQTKTAEFRRWFGDSKVVDANGEPLVVYHGTPGKGFTVFDTGKAGKRTDFGNVGVGVYTTPAKFIADAYAGTAGTTMPLYAAVINPLRITYDESFQDRVAQEAQRLGVTVAPEWKGAGVANREFSEQFTERAQAAGHDGVLTVGTDGSIIEAVAFRSEQIKSATANRGTFDPNDPSILNQQPTNEGPRGQISIFPDRRMSIALFERADKTTFLHESAHFFFEVYRDLAAMPDADPGIAADFDKLLQWFGVENVDAITDDHLEQFARGFEAYLGEGKAPSPELRGIFAKFSAWVLGVYRSLRGLNVELTDEVRGVFDRMLASEEEIELAQVRQGMVPIALDASEAAGLGLTDRQFEDYRAMVEAANEEARLEVFNKTVGALQRERMAWWKEERAKVREEVAGRYEETQAVRALRILSGRRVVNGVTLEPPLAGMKLDRTAVVAGWGDAYLKRLGKTYAKAGGLHPDEAAPLLGFQSGDDLLRAVANAPDLIARVDSETDAIMRERHGDPMTDGTLAEKAMDAVHGSKRVQLLARELEILGKLTNEPAPNARMLKAIATQQIARKTPRQVRPNDYLAAERRASLEAVKAAARGDYADAMVAKRRQALSVALYRAARDSQEQFATDLRYLQAMTTDARRSRLGKAGADYLEQVDGLLEAIELRPASGAEVQRRGRLLEWVRRQEKAGVAVDVPLKLLAEAGLTNVRDMTHEDIRGVVDTIKQIEHLAKTKTRLRLNGIERDREEVDAEMAASVLAAHDLRPERTGDTLNGLVMLPGNRLPRLRLERTRALITDLDIGRLLPTNIARDLDGYEAGGAVWEHVIRPIREAMYQRVIPAMHAMQEAVSGIYQKHYTPDEIRRLDTAIWRESVGDSWSKGRILTLAMNWGSEGNREAILTQAQSRLTEEQAVALLRTLDARDWAFVQDMIDKVNSYWPEIAEAQRRRTGLVPEKVEAKPFAITNDAGATIVVRGGYFPLKYDSERSGYGTTINEIEEAFEDLRVGRSARAHTKHGHTIERVGSGGKTVDLSLDNAVSHMRMVIRDLYLGDAVNYVAATLNGSEFKNAVVGVGKRQYLDALNLWLKDVATGEIGPRNTTEKAIRLFRQNTTAAVMTWKASSAMVQLTGLVQTGSVIGNAATLRGLNRLLSKSWIGPNSIWNELREKSPFMRERFGQLADAVEVVQSQRDGRFKSARSKMILWGYVPMARVQMIVDATTWLAGEAVGLKKFDGDIEKARAFADDLVIRAQSPEGFFEKSQIGRGTLDLNLRQSEAVRASTMLLSYMIAKGNIMREKYQQTEFTKPAQVLKFSADMVQLFAVEAIVMALLRNGLPEDEEDDGIADDWAAFVGKELLLGPIATIPLLSQLATEGRGYTAQGVMERGWSQAEGATSRWLDGELDRKDLKAMISVSGVAAGVPSSQINTTADALWRVHDGEDVAPLDYLVKPEKPRE